METRPPAEHFVEPARVAWVDGRPRSAIFDDIYYAADGARETGRVFLEPTAFETRVTAQAGTHTLVELGFGTGLNFAETAARFLRAAGGQGRLHYIGIDRHPLTHEAFHRSAETVGDDLLKRLSACYPPLTTGWHRRHLAGGRITLTLFWGDAEAALIALAERTAQPVDTWFLDGFAPERNPAMWTDPLLARLGALSAPAARVATFTAVGAVRRSLEAAGFAMTRVDQRPHKRHSLAGTFQGPGRPVPARATHVTIAGAGFAGASTARHLAERGVRVTVYDPAQPAAGASGLPATLLHGRLLTDRSAQATFRLASYSYSVAYTDGYPGLRGLGTLQRPGGNRTTDDLRALADHYAATGPWCSWRTHEALAEDPLAPADGGLWFPHASVVDGARLITALLDHAAIELRTGPAPEHDAPLVLAHAHHAAAHPATGYLELVPIAGQVERVTLKQPLPWAIAGNGYVAPLPDGDAVVGATFEYQPWAPADAIAHNLAKLAGRPHQHRHSVRRLRAVTSDRTPIAGAVYDEAGAPVPGLYLNTGHGSLGASSSHYCADLIASQLTGEVAAVNDAVLQACSSLRFRERQARRGYRHGAAPAMTNKPTKTKAN